MSGQIVSFSAAKKKKDAAKKTLTTQNKRLILTHHINLLCECVQREWNEHITLGNINQYISDTLNVPLKDYINDLELVTGLQKLFGMNEFGVLSPNCTRYNPQGWMVTFKHKGIHKHLSDETDKDSVLNLMRTPETSSEQHARLLALILFMLYDILIEEFERDFLVHESESKKK